MAQLRHFNMKDETYYTLKELAMLRGKSHVAYLVQEIFQDYINQHKNELLHQ
jgi:predicted DNA-binding protein